MLYAETNAGECFTNQNNLLKPLIIIVTKY